MPHSRRNFIIHGGIAAGSAALARAAEAATPAIAARMPNRIKLGTQEPTSEENFRRFQRYGVTHVCGWYKIADQGRLYPTVDELKAVTDLAARYDITVAMTDTPVGRGAHSALMLGGDGREREIEALQRTIRNCAAAGIPALNIISPSCRSCGWAGWPGAATRAMRAGIMPARRRRKARLSWPAATRRSCASSARIIAASMPVCSGSASTMSSPASCRSPMRIKVRLAQHPHDPGLGPAGIAGIPNALGNVEGLKRFVALHESPYHGLNFCQGTICENLPDPRTQIFDVIKWFGSRKKIFNVHFRNIRGHRGAFVAEVFPDDGEIDMARAVRAYRDVGYDGMLMPDHVPEMQPGQAARTEEMFTFAYGYIRALIQAAA